MFLSVFEMFKVGIGPSSSHTMGPMVAAARFLETMRGSPFEFKGLQATLHGSLAFTGVGHATDRAVMLGLAGYLPAEIDPNDIDKIIADINRIDYLKAIGAFGTGNERLTHAAFGSMNDDIGHVT